MEHHEGNGANGALPGDTGAAAGTLADAALRWQRTFAAMTPEQQEMVRHLGPPKRSPAMEKYLEELLARQEKSGGVEKIFGALAAEESDDEFLDAVMEIS